MAEEAEGLGKEAVVVVDAVVDGAGHPPAVGEPILFLRHLAELLEDAVA